MNMYPPSTVLLPGRWQPLQSGHVKLVESLLDNGCKVVVGIFDTPISDRNPFTMEQRIDMFHREFGEEIADGEVSLIPLPWVREIVYGRDCGWSSRHVRLSPDIERLSATAIRQESRR